MKERKSFAIRLQISDILRLVIHEFYLTGETGKRTITNFKFLEFAYAIIYVVCKSLEVFILFGGGGVNNFLMK